MRVLAAVGTIPDSTGFPSSTGGDSIGLVEIFEASVRISSGVTVVTTGEGINSNFGVVTVLTSGNCDVTVLRSGNGKGVTVTVTVLTTSGSNGKDVTVLTSGNSNFGVTVLTRIGAVDKGNGAVTREVVVIVWVRFS